MKTAVKNFVSGLNNVKNSISLPDFGYLSGALNAIVLTVFSLWVVIMVIIGSVVGGVWLQDTLLSCGSWDAFVQILTSKLQAMVEPYSLAQCVAFVLAGIAVLQIASFFVNWLGFVVKVITQKQPFSVVIEAANAVQIKVNRFMGYVTLLAGATALVYFVWAALAQSFPQ